MRALHSTTDRKAARLDSNQQSHILQDQRDSNPHHTAWQAGIVNHSTMILFITILQKTIKIRTPERTWTFNSLIKSQVLYQLSYKSIILVHPEGLEPSTDLRLPHWLKASCSTNWAIGAYFLIRALYTLI